MKNKTKNKSEGGSQTAEVGGQKPERQDQGSTESRPTISSGEFKMIARSAIRPDPQQPRKDFSEAQLQEMAVSIYLQGIIQPLVVKHVPAELKIIEPDMMNGKMWQALKIADGSVVFESKEEGAVRAFASGMLDEFYQLIAGERRWRSTIPQRLELDGQTIEWPGLNTLPCMVRVADDQATFALQHIENQKRVNLSALEEAQSFGSELERRRAQDPTWTAERLGDELGIKRGTVFNLMKLLRLKEPVRLALLAGRIETSHARAIAQVPDVKRQEELLELAAEGDNYDGGMMSIRELQDLIDGEYVKQLKDAPFDQAAEDVVRVTWCVRAGENEIVLECPKRPSIPNLGTIGVPKLHPSNASAEYGKFYVTSADNFDMAGPLPKKQAKELVEFLTANAKAGQAVVSQASGWACGSCPHRSGVMDPTTKTPKVCTLPACFDAKVKAHWVKKSEELNAAGTPVLTEGEMRKLGKHVPEDRYEYSEGRTWKQIVGKHEPEPVLVATKEGIKKFYPEEEAIAAAKKNGVKMHASAGPKSAEQKAKEEAAEKKREELKKSRTEIADDVMEDLAKALAKVGDREAWELADKQKVETWSYESRAMKVLITGGKTAKARVLGRRFAHRDLRLVDYNGEWDKDTVAEYAKLGIDVLAIEKERAKAKQPAKELPLAKAEPQQKSLLTVQQKGPKIKGKKK